MIKIAFLYRTNHYFFSEARVDTNIYDFLFLALKRNPEVSIESFQGLDVFDAYQLKGKFDLIILWDNHEWGAPDRILNLDKTDIPVFMYAGDPHYADTISLTNNCTRIELARRYCVKHLFGIHTTNYFYKFWPSEFKFTQMMFGLEKASYDNLPPFELREKGKIVNFGDVSSDDFYKLRMLVNALPFVAYFGRDAGFVAGRLPKLLGGYRAMVAANTKYFVFKYMEGLFSGNVVFAEVTEQNECEKGYGLIDGENCIFINESNYRQKMTDYITNADDPKYKTMSLKARALAEERFDNNIVSKSFIEIIKNNI